MAGNRQGASASTGGNGTDKESTHLVLGTSGKEENKFESVTCTTCGSGLPTDHRCRKEILAPNGQYSFTMSGETKRICGRTICACCIIDSNNNRCSEHNGDTSTGTRSDDDDDAAGTASETADGASETAGTQSDISTAESSTSTTTATVRAAEVNPKSKNLSVYDYDAESLHPAQYYDPKQDNPNVLFSLAFGTDYAVDPETDDDFKEFIGNDSSRSYIFGKKSNSVGKSTK